MKETVEIAITADSLQQEILLANLNDLPFEGFEQRELTILAFMPAGRWDALVRDSLIRILRTLHLDDSFEERHIPEQDWTRRWEESICPIHVGRFCIRPSWSSIREVAPGQVGLLMDPKMSFGTGYHESTRLMLILLPEFVVPGSVVLDVGTGTGILAIAAAKLGASRVLGLDTDPWSFENAIENSALNCVTERLEIRLASVKAVPQRAYSVVLANIDSSTLIELLPEFGRCLFRDGNLLMSGLQRSDRSSILKAMSAEGFEQIREEYEGDWWAVASKRVEAL